MYGVINKTMDRADLLGEDAQPIIRALNELIAQLYCQGLYISSWYGTLPLEPGLSRENIKRFVKRLLGRKVDDRVNVGFDNRGPRYQPLPGACDDARIPWYLYWEIYWVMTHGPSLTPTMKLLDAGGASSLFSCYLGLQGYEVHSIDLNGTLVANANRIAKAMGWNMFSYAMDMTRLEFEDESFDHAYSVCVFEHLRFEDRQAALREIARCLKPDGILSLTFDYRNPAPAICDYGPDPSERNALKTEGDLWRNFLSTGCFSLLGNHEFSDNGESYLVHTDPRFANCPYTFGALFLRKKKAGGATT